VGTPDYIAPEVLKKQSATNFTIDWWSLGVIVYEVLVGERPFGAQTVDDVFDNILHRRIEWPEIGYGEQMMTPEAKDLILKLLEPDYTKRLGCNGTVEIKHHAFF
jgi:serine/threonine protein kinase